MVLEVGSGRDKVCDDKILGSPLLCGCLAKAHSAPFYSDRHRQFHKLSTALSNELRRAFRAKTYYEEARFHASTVCLETTDDVDHRADEQGLLGARFSQIVTDIEKRWGPQLRKQPPTWAARVGIQVANRITYVDI